MGLGHLWAQKRCFRRFSSGSNICIYSTKGSHTIQHIPSAYHIPSNDCPPFEGRSKYFEALCSSHEMSVKLRVSRCGDI
jgi:hypothetical protein